MSVKFKKSEKINKLIRVGLVDVKFINCEVLKGITITIDQEFKELTIENCSFENDCFIGSNMNNCFYSQKGELKVFDSQPDLFVFNNIFIEGGIEIDDKNSVLTFVGNGDLRIIAGTGISLASSKLTIENNGRMILDSDINGIVCINSIMKMENSSELTINSEFSCFLVQPNSIVSFSNNRKLLLNLFEKGFDLKGEVVFKTDPQLTFKSSDKSIINFSNKFNSSLDDEAIEETFKMSADKL